MRILTLLRRTRALLSRSRNEDELREEIASHIWLRRQQLIDDGMDPRDAEYEARRMFGNVAAIREQSRDLWTLGGLDALVQDTRFGIRLLRRSPIFTFAAVASLAIGIGSAAAVFSLADGLLFRQLQVRNPNELVLFRWIAGPELPFASLNGYGKQTQTETSSTSFSTHAYQRIRSALASEVDLFAFADLYTVNLALDGQPETGSAQVVSGNYFNTLGLSAAAGRLLGESDDRVDAPPAAVIGYDVWRRRFGADPAAIGRTLVLNGISFTIAGVLPRGFTGTLQVGQPCDVMVPLASYKALTHNQDDPDNPNHWWVLMMGRLKPGITRDRVETASDVILKQTVAAAKPEFPADKRPLMRVEPGGLGQTEDRDSMREPIQIMAAVVLVVLLAACANVANLLLARGRARAQEVAVRAAIGASRRRIVRQLLTEGLLLGMLASIAGLVLAQWISSALLPAVTADAENLAIGYALDLRILVFTCALGMASSILFALVPALRTTHATLTPAVHEGGTRQTLAARRGLTGGGSLVVVQVALSMLLLSCAALLGWSAYRLQRMDPGFDPRNLLTFTVDVSLNGYDGPRAGALVERALERLRAVPGVTSATVTSHRLIANSSAIGVARPEGSPAVEVGSAEARELNEKFGTWRLHIEGSFFETFRIPLLRGRTFGPSPRPDGPPVAIVNEALARQLFGNTEVIGRRFVMGLGPHSRPLEIVGVVKDARYTSMRRDPPPTAYLPYQQVGFSRLTFAVRTAGHPMTLAASIREAMRSVDDTLPLFGMRTQQEQIHRSLNRERLFASLSLILGGVTLVLSGIGLYGLLAYAVTRRTREIGVRMALGAGAGEVRWMILRHSLIMVAGGLLLGIPAAVASSRFVESLLFGLDPYDPRALAAAAVVMATVGVIAGYVPARRASRIDPLTALRAE